jgi:hypothetical protein
MLKSWFTASTTSVLFWKRRREDPLLLAARMFADSAVVWLAPAANSHFPSFFPNAAVAEFRPKRHFYYLVSRFTTPRKVWKTGVAVAAWYQRSSPLRHQGLRNVVA